MKKSRFTESQIVAVLKDSETGVLVAELHRLHELEAENAKIKRMYADLALENIAMRDVLDRKSPNAVCPARGGAATCTSQVTHHSHL